MDRLCFHPCLSVCLFVFKQDISKSCAQIQPKFGGELGYVTRSKCLDFGEDPNPDLDPIITHADDSLGVGRVFGCVCVCVCLSAL